MVNESKIRSLIEDIKDTLGGDIDYKAAFLNKMIDCGEFSYRTLEQTIFLFKNIAYFENDIFMKDIYDFTYEEMSVLLGGLKRITEQVLASDKVLLDKYIANALNDGKGLQGTHATFNIKRRDLKKYLHKIGREGRYPTRNELFSTFEQLTNFQDKAIFVLLWNGFYNKNYTLMANLKIEDFDASSRTLQLIDIDEESGEILREEYVKLDEESAFILEQAIDETRYETVVSKKKKTKVEIDGKIESVVTVDELLTQKRYAESEYILKRIEHDLTTHGEPRVLNAGIPVSNQIVMSRIKTCKNAVNKKYWKGVSIFMAGIVYRMLKESFITTWDNKTMEDYLNTHGYKINLNNFRDVFDILTDKYSNENCPQLEIASTQIRA